MTGETLVSLPNQTQSVLSRFLCYLQSLRNVIVILDGPARWEIKGRTFGLKGGRSRTGCRLHDNEPGDAALQGNRNILCRNQYIAVFQHRSRRPSRMFRPHQYEKEETGTTGNPNREIDLAEVSWWANQASPPCEDIKD